MVDIRVQEYKNYTSYSIMEECMICFDLIQPTEFITFSCKHKVCRQCYPKLTHCPLCNIELVEEDTCYVRLLQCLCLVSGAVLCVFILRFNT